MKRDHWKLGIVIRLLKGADGRIRPVVLKTCKNGVKHFITRQIDKLYPLEVRCHEDVSDDDLSVITEYNISIR